MIIYFASRHMKILGQASTALPEGLVVTEDKKTEEIETGIATFSCRIPFTESTRKKAEECVEVGNYILRSDGDDNEFYTIIETELDTESRDICIYAEDAGLDLLNEVALEYTADKEYPLTYYIKKWILDSGFEIGINESNDKESKKLGWSSESTVTERLIDVCEQFGCELSFGFEIKNMAVTHKYANIYKQRGKDVGMQLRLNKDVNKVVVKKSAANVATALLCTGATLEGSDLVATLEGYKYDDGDFYVDGRYLKSRNAVAKWSRYKWTDEPSQLAGYEGHIVKTFQYDTVSQAELCKQAIIELKKAGDAEVNYEAEITKLPSNIRIGDRISVIDEEGKLYLSARLLILETSVIENTRTATLGEYLIKEGGVSQKVQELASQFAELAKNRIFYTWFAYADDEKGSGISLDPNGKAYLGTCTNKLTQAVDITDPSIFTWVKIKGDPAKDGEPGSDGISVTSVVDQYCLSTSAADPPANGWIETIPVWETGKYVWRRYRVTWSDGTTTYTDAVLDNTMNHANETAEYAKQQAEDAQKSAESASNSASSAQESATKAEKEVLNQKTEMQRMTGLITKSLGIFQTAVQQADGSAVFYMHDKPKLEESQTIWRMAAGVFSVSTDGGTSWNAGIDAQGNTVVNMLSAIGINFDWARGGQLTLGGRSNTNGTFRLLANDDSEMIRMDYEGIKLANGASLMSANGVCGNLQFVSNSGVPELLGDGNHLYLGGDPSGVIYVYVHIPDNYFVEKAILTLKSNGGLWNKVNGKGGIIGTVKGTSRQIKIYKGAENAGIAMGGDFGEACRADVGSWTQIVSGAFTASGPTGSTTQSTKTLTSGNIASYLDVGLNVFRIAAQKFESKAKEDVDKVNAELAYLGSGIGIIDLIGYSKN